MFKVFIFLFAILIPIYSFAETIESKNASNEKEAVEFYFPRINAIALFNMNNWQEKYIFNLSVGGFFHLLNNSFSTLAIICIIMGIEIFVVGYKKSSLTRILKPKKNEFLDILSLFLYCSGLKFIASNIFYFGFLIYIKTITGIDFFLLARFPALMQMPLWLKVIMAVIVYDFLFYLCHRLKHESKWLWNLHEFHHSSTRVTALTTLRAHPMDLLANQIGIFIPMGLIFGADIKNSFLFISPICSSI